MATNPVASVSSGAPQETASFGLDYFVRLNRPTFEAMTALNKRFLEHLATFNSARILPGRGSPRTSSSPST